MKSLRNMWNEEYLKLDIGKPVYDLWLDRYSEIFEKNGNEKIIDLGCGRGNNSLYLTERGFKVISCDISDAAVNNVRACIPQAETMVFDMLDGLPFGNYSADIVIADLCLHYFTWTDTERILKDINRILKPGGRLFARVNSVRDENYGAGQGRKIEKNYYEADGRRKRFFDRHDVLRLFDQWKLGHVDEYEMNRYGLPKILWEIMACKK